MMKRIFLLTAFLLINAHVSEASYYNQASDSLRDVGRAIEGVDNLPVVGKLTNLLPFALIASGFKECPMQTMVVVAGFLAYMIFNHDAINAKLQQYNPVNYLRARKKTESIKPVIIDETLFIFEGDDEDDAQDYLDAEDDLLFPEDDKHHTKQIKQNKNSARKF
jgi:hypothetical protein